MASKQLSVVLRLLVSAALLFGAGAVDSTLEDGATGSDVVQAVIAKLDASRVAFGNDHRFLRRLAFVETADGTSDGSPISGGLWRLQQSQLDAIRSAPQLAELRVAIRASFGIDWGAVTIDDLGKPFLAGLAARLHLFYLEVSGTAVIPLAGDILGQARFWLGFYHTDVGGVSRTEFYFVEHVDLLEEREGCKVNMDIFFVLDGSGSIGATNFDQVRQFEHDFVQQLRVGPKDDQVGTIVFSTSANVIFQLNTYNTTESVQSHTLAMNYPSGSTNTADGLCKLVRYGFADGNGARPSSGAVFRIAIVMTDGKSNKDSAECQWNTLEAAAAVHELTPPVLVYVIGVTNSVNDDELNAIATHATHDFVTRIGSFDPHVIQETQERHTEEVCKRATLPADTHEETNGTLDQNETVRYHYQVPVAGITVRVCISLGHVAVYGSFSVPNPNSAFYDFFLDFTTDGSESETCRETYIDPDKIPPSPGTQPSSSTQTQGAPPTPTPTPLGPQPTVQPSSAPPVVQLTDKIIYLSVVGVADENNFVLNGSIGDTFPQEPSSTILLYPSSTIHPSSTSTAQSSSTAGEVFIIAVAIGAGVLVVVVLLLALFCSLCCCCVVCRRSKSVRVDQYNLLSPDSSADFPEDV